MFSLIWPLVLLGLLLVMAKIYAWLNPTYQHAELGEFTLQNGCWVAILPELGHRVHCRLRGSPKEPLAQDLQDLVEFWGRRDQVLESCRGPALEDYHETSDRQEPFERSWHLAQLHAKAEGWELFFEVAWDPQQPRRARFARDGSLLDYGLSQSIRE